MHGEAMNDNIFPEVQELCGSGRFKAAVARLSQLNPIDAAELLEQLPPVQATAVFRIFQKDFGAEVFSNLPPVSQEYIISAITNSEVAGLIGELYIDDAVDMLGELPATVVKRVLKNAQPETRMLINRFLSYPEDSAGSVMTAEFLDLKKEMTVAQAKNYIRQNGVDKETVYTCYVTDAQRVLEGVVSFRDLLFAAPDALVKDLMKSGCVSVRATDDRETVAQLISKYDLLALPVTDSENRLVGIVTYDDALDVMESESTEDFHRMAAVAPSRGEYLDTGVFSLAKNRIVWLMFLMLASVLSGLVIGNYEAAIGAIPLLASFVPVITDTGGNAGAQSSTVIIRAMTLGEITTHDWLRVLFKEGSVSLLCGITLAVVNFLRIIVFNPGNIAIAFSVSLSIIAAVVMAKLLGSALPLFAKTCGIDPAVMAAPLITTTVDTLSLMAYFAIASVLLRI